MLQQKNIWELKRGDRYWGVYGFSEPFRRQYVAVFTDMHDAEEYARHPDFEAGPNGLYVGPMRRKS
jgi:hypothetical protein